MQSHQARRENTSPPTWWLDYSPGQALLLDDVLAEPLGRDGRRAAVGLHVVHRLFDLLVLAMVSSGIGMALLGDVFPAVFGVSKNLPTDFASLPLHTLHRSVGITLFVLLALHVGGALYHQIVLRDGLLGRMGLSFARR